MDGKDLPGHGLEAWRCRKLGVISARNSTKINFIFSLKTREGLVFPGGVHLDLLQPWIHVRADRGNIIRRQRPEGGAIREEYIAVSVTMTGRFTEAIGDILAVQGTNLIDPDDLTVVQADR